jgi:O-acetylserine/cysteine efflux transporter
MERADVTPSRLSLKDGLLALAIIFVWGTNFTIIRIGLDTIPPLFFAALRFSFTLLPAAFFLPRPKTSWANMAIYGVSIGLGQFGLLFIAMNGMISPGLASLVIQTQAFFTIALAVFRSGEKLKAHQYLAFALAAAGMGLIMAHNGDGATIAGLGLTLAAAASWAVCNQAAKEAGSINMLAYVVWSSLFALPPLYALALWHDGLPAIVQGLSRATPAIWAVVAWQGLGNTVFGFGCWAWLTARYPAATIAPLSLLVPVFGFAASALVLGEPIQGWKIGAAGLVIAGLGANMLWRPSRTACPEA